MITSTSIAGDQGQSTYQRERLEQYDHFSAPVHALLALDAGRMGSWALNIITGEVIGDRFVANLLHFDYEAQPWQIGQFFESVDPEDRNRVQAAVDKALSGENPYYDIEFRANRSATLEPIRWLGARGQVTERDENDAPLRMVGVNWDATEQKKTEEKLAALASEMDHRVKDTFEVIRALINLGDHTADSKEDLASTLRAQVDAMVTAHAMSARMALTTSDPTSCLSLQEVIETALSPWLAGDANIASRIKITCDPTIMIPPRKVSPLAMILYEISTNAAKYGPLNTEADDVTIDVTRQGSDAVHLVWSETTDTTSQPTAAAAGFETVLLDHCAANLGGSITRMVDKTGLRIALTMNVAG